jgi:hypothetical protein
VVMPAYLAEPWQQLGQIAQAAAQEHSDISRLSDVSLRRQYVQVKASLDDAVAADPCDPQGLPTDFGCASHESCAASLLANDAGGRATSWVSAQGKAFAAESGWMVTSCRPRASFCRLQHMRGQSELAAVFVDFASITDGRAFMWWLRPA